MMSAKKQSWRLLYIQFQDLESLKNDWKPKFSISGLIWNLEQLASHFLSVEQKDVCQLGVILTHGELLSV